MRTPTDPPITPSPGGEPPNIDLSAGRRVRGSSLEGEQRASDSQPSRGTESPSSTDRSSSDLFETSRSSENADRTPRLGGEAKVSTAGRSIRVTPDAEKLYLSERSEEFTLELPFNGEAAKPVTVRLESLKALMARGDAEEVFDRYYEGYSRCFTDPNEVERKEDLRTLLEVGKGDWDVSVITHEDRIVAGYHTKLARITSYDLGVFSIGDYLWADKAMRGYRLGQSLYSKTIEFRMSQGAQGHFGEIRDVYLLPQRELIRDWNSGTTSQQRIGFWKKQDRMALDAPWIQPALSEGQKEVDFYMVTLSKFSDTCPSKFPREAYLELWTKFYPRHKSSSTFESLQQLTLHTPLINLIPLESPRTYIRAVRWPPANPKGPISS